MKTAFLLIFLGCIPAYAQDAGTWAAQQASQQAMDGMNAAAARANLQMMQSSAPEAATQALIDLQVQQANQQIMQLQGQTPGAARLHGVTRKPLFSMKSGNVAQGTKIRIRCFTRIVSIYYTVDGSTPTMKSLPYRGPIRIGSSMQIRAIAFGPGMAPSLIATAELHCSRACERHKTGMTPCESSDKRFVLVTIAAAFDDCDKWPVIIRDESHRA